jgi:alpha-glucosidase
VLENRHFVPDFRMNQGALLAKLKVLHHLPTLALRGRSVPSSMNTEWWRGATLYQIYPRSFADANGDGIGDLAGITRRLAHVASLGVDGIWISPFFPSPMRDFGYDVSDHWGVDPRFGRLAEFDALVAEAHRLGLKVVIDQVWSHTAAEHPWFQESRASRDNPKADWYVWADARDDGSPPNNWLSWMGGPAWRWEPRRRQYHLHHFLPQMPDLNFHCPAVQDAVLEIARFWLDRGVDGFRLDTANLYAHDLLLRDNPAAPPDQRGDSPVLMQAHTRTMDQPESLAFLRRLRAVMDGYPGRMAVGEIGGGQALATMRAYTRGTDALHTAYSFAFLGERPDAPTVAQQLAPWAAGEGWPSWAFSNHDAPRVASRWSTGAGAGFGFGGGSVEAARGRAAAQGADALTWMALLMALRGTLFVYQGEELGLRQSEVPFNRLQDPYGLANWPLNPGRDGCRTPMPWVHDAPHAGFGSAEPWLPVDPAHAAMAVDRQEADAGSMLHHTRALLRLRREQPALRTGACEVLHAQGDVLALRRGEGEGAVLAVFNLGSTAAELPAALAPCVLDPAHGLWQHPGAPMGGATLPAGAAAFFRAP